MSMETASPRRRILTMAAAVAACSIALIAHSAAPLRAGLPSLAGVSVQDDPVTVAHRGASLVAPENTLAALELAIESGAEFVETDLRLTSDGVPVLLHDAELDRTTTGRGEVAELTFRELREVSAGEWFAPGYEAERVPTLAEFLRLLAPSGAKAILELKGDWDVAGLETVERLLRRYGVESRVVFAAFRLGSLEAAREVVPLVPRLLLAEEPRSKELERAASVDAAAIAVSADGLASLEEPERWFDSLTHGGLLAVVYTVDDVEEWDRLASWPVFAVVTDRGAEHRSWTEGRLS